MFAHVWCGGVEWGAFPEWLEAVGTLGALSFALFQYRNYLGDQARQQASKVSVWASQYRYPSSGPSSATAVVYNGSDQPVYDCSLRLLSWDWRTKPERLHGIRFPVIQPQSKTGGHRVDNGLTAPPESEGVVSPPYEIEFSDAAGHRWVRKPDGRLTRIES